MQTSAVFLIDAGILMSKHEGADMAKQCRQQPAKHRISLQKLSLMQDRLPRPLPGNSSYRHTYVMKRHWCCSGTSGQQDRAAPASPKSLRPNPVMNAVRIT
jgi:hypothetical protein